MNKLLKALWLTVGLLVSNQLFSADMDVNTDVNDVAIKGYDPVAYYIEGQPSKGNTEFTATHKGAIYRFSSANNRDLFKSDPEKYAPQYGGYCAFGVSMEKKFDTDPTAWKIIEDKLYLNLNAQVQKRWLQNANSLVSEADGNWKDIAFVPEADL